MGAYYTRPDAEAQHPVSFYQTRLVGPGGLLDSTGLGGTASGHLCICVRCERTIIVSMGSNDYVGLNWTHGSLVATGHVRYSDRTRPVFTIGASSAASSLLDCSVRSARVMPSEGV